MSAHLLHFPVLLQKSGRSAVISTLMRDNQIYSRFWSWFCQVPPKQDVRINEDNVRNPLQIYACANDSLPAQNKDQQVCMRLSHCRRAAECLGTGRRTWCLGKTAARPCRKSIPRSLELLNHHEKENTKIYVLCPYLLRGLVCTSELSWQHGMRIQGRQA